MAVDFNHIGLVEWQFGGTHVQTMAEHKPEQTVLFMEKKLDYKENNRSYLDIRF